MGKAILLVLKRLHVGGGHEPGLGAVHFGATPLRTMAPQTLRYKHLNQQPKSGHLLKPPPLGCVPLPGGQKQIGISSLHRELRGAFFPLPHLQSIVKIRRKKAWAQLLIQDLLILPSRLLIREHVHHIYIISWFGVSSSDTVFRFAVYRR